MLPLTVTEILKQEADGVTWLSTYKGPIAHYCISFSHVRIQNLMCKNNSYFLILNC